MSEEQVLQQCLQAFVNRDYAGFVQKATGSRLATATNYHLLHLLLISLQRFWARPSWWNSWDLRFLPRRQSTPGSILS